MFLKGINTQNIAQIFIVRDSFDTKYLIQKCVYAIHLIHFEVRKSIKY